MDEMEDSFSEYLNAEIDRFAQRNGGIRNWSYARIAGVIGLSKSNLSVYTKVGGTPDIPGAAKIAEFFGADVWRYLPEKLRYWIKLADSDTWEFVRQFNSLPVDKRAWLVKFLNQWEALPVPLRVRKTP